MISWRHVTQWTRYVPHDRAEDYCRCGWCIADAFDGTPHAAYCVMCAWLCACKPVEPRDNRAARIDVLQTVGATASARPVEPTSNLGEKIDMGPGL